MGVPSHLIVARIALPLAILIVLCATIADGVTDGKSLVALIPAGALLVVRGVLMLRYRETVLEPLARREEKGTWGSTGLRIEHRFGAAMFLIIGVGWAMMGAIHGL
jgi:hypothetical protein